MSRLPWLCGDFATQQAREQQVAGVAEFPVRERTCFELLDDGSDNAIETTQKAVRRQGMRVGMQERLEERRRPNRRADAARRRL